MYLVTTSNFSTAADFPIKIQQLKPKSLLNKEAQVSYLSYDCYREFSCKQKIDTTDRATASSANGSSLGPLEFVTYPLLLGTYEYEHKFIVCKQLLGLEFVQNFKVGIEQSHLGHLYLHQDDKLLAYSKPNPSKDPTLFSVECDEAILISRTNILVFPKPIAAVFAKMFRLHTSGVKTKLQMSSQKHFGA